MSWSGVENLREGLTAQRSFLESRVPSYARILQILESDLSELERRVEPLWRERRFDAWYERPLLLLAALRYDALLEGPRHPLHRAIVAEPPSAGTVTPEAVRAAISPQRDRVSVSLASRAIQTNETSRAVSWMWVARMIEDVDPGRTCVLVDMGSSAGLNLVADLLPRPWDDQEGRPIPTTPLPRIAARFGIDLRPLDALDPDTQTWLRACVWPGDSARLERLDEGLAALETVASSGQPIRLEAMGLEEAPARLDAIEGVDRVIAVQTIVRDYLPDEVKNRYVAGMREWIAGAPPASAIWVELENTQDAHDPDRMASLSVHFRPLAGGVKTLEIARTHPHPRRLFVDPVAVSELKRAISDCCGVAAGID